MSQSRPQDPRPPAGSDDPRLRETPRQQDSPAQPPTPTGYTRRRPGLDEHGRLRSGRLAGLSMGGAIWVLAWPIMVESFLHSFVGLTDTVLAAGIDVAATDAIGGASYIVWFIGLIAMALGIGATALISRSMGAGKIPIGNAVLGQTMLLGAICGVLVGVLVAAMASPLAALLNMSDASAEAFTLYMRLIAAGVPFSTVLFAGIACARGAGDSTRPLYAMALVSIINIAASWILSGVDIQTTRLVGGELVTRTVLANPFTFDLGIAGIALGTVLAHIAGSIVILVMAASGTWGIRLRRRWLRPHLLTIKRLVRLGVPNFLETFGLWIGNFLVIVLVGLIGSEGYLGAHIVAVRIEAFSFLPGFAMSVAAATLAGQYLGAGSPTMARRAVLRCTLIAALIMGTMGALFIAFPTTIVGLFSSQPIHLELTPRIIMIAGFVQIPFAVAIVIRGALRGAGDVTVVMWITWLTTYAVRLPLAYALSGVAIPLPERLGGGAMQNPFPFEAGLVGIWIGLCLELTIRGVVFAVRFAQPGWTHKRV